jgi:dihydrolipoamide dehydrogenase
VGGTCLNRGCIPTKALLASAEAWRKARAGEGVRFRAHRRGPSRFHPHHGAQERVVTHLREQIEVLLKKAKVQGGYAAAEASTGPGTVLVGHSRRAGDMEADRIILANGSEPAYSAHVRLLPSVYLGPPLQPGVGPRSRHRLLIVGAGVIGCEFASFFAEMGTQIPWSR